MYQLGIIGLIRVTARYRPDIIGSVAPPIAARHVHTAIETRIPVYFNLLDSASCQLYTLPFLGMRIRLLGQLFDTSLKTDSTQARISVR